MLNYVKAEWFRIVRGRELYLFAGILSAVAFAAIGIHFVMATTPGFPYATVRFTLGILTSALPMQFVLAGVLAMLLYGGDRKDGTLKNAIAAGCSRPGLFVGRCIACTAAGLLSLAVVMAVYVGSAALLLEGPAAEPVLRLLEGVAASLPSTIASAVLAVAVLLLCESTSIAALVWMGVAFIVPSVLERIGQAVEPVAALAGWIPSNFFATDVVVTMSRTRCLWDEPFGWEKCLIAGFACLALAIAFGVWRARKLEL